MVLSMKKKQHEDAHLSKTDRIRKYFFYLEEAMKLSLYLKPKPKGRDLKTIKNHLEICQIWKDLYNEFDDETKS